MIIKSAVIPSSGDTSPEVDLGVHRLVGIILPGTFTGTALTFLMSDASGGTFVAVNNDSGLISKTVAANKYLPVNPDDFLGIRFIKVKSGSTEGAARTVKLVTQRP